jgi:N-glycosylase/DNA lyase
MLISNTDADDFKNIWYEYFDLGTDYSKIKSEVSKDEVMQKAVSCGCGMRILRQDFWETLISFIISSNNNIPRIKKIVEKLASEYGDELTYKDKKYYAFPSASTLSKLSPEEIGICRGGYRCGYLSGTSSRMITAGIDKKYLEGIGTAHARNALLEFSGVGPKVADCVLLYSGTKFDVFPTDVWVRRVMEILYLHKPASLKEIQSFSSGYFGDLAGYAQQYLFYYARLSRL